MKLPTVVIIGRPNVGKSTLFNRIAGRRRAIVEDIPGVTRDNLIEQAEYYGRRFWLVDTGGILPAEQHDFVSEIAENVASVLEEADRVIFLMDLRDGLTAGDREVIARLRKAGRPYVCALNKADGARHRDNLPEFYETGEERLFPISALSGEGVDELLEAAIDWPAQPDDGEPAGDEWHARIAIIGRTNTGKSSLLNRLAGTQRSIVSPVAGTTRDCVDTAIVAHGRSYLVVDTAGMRRRTKVTGKLERITLVRTVAAIERADVALLVMDASEPFTDQDKKIAALAHRKGRPVVAVINKWDLVPEREQAFKELSQRVGEELGFLYTPEVVFTSALTGQRVSKLLPAVDRVMERYRREVQTSRLNRFLEQVFEELRPHHRTGREIRINYGTQTDRRPPAFTFFANLPGEIPENWVRFFRRRLIEEFDLEGVPVRIHFRAKSVRRRRETGK